ncbi:MAG: ABC transporter ATP-binding protein, partial [Flammeovirgaceae bacterium]
GRNGAGKSTLLKILSKITPPSTGKIITRGRIASLLEVGTGFHPELSGRENIFFNGSILGMKHREIQKHFDAIVDFSGIEKFLDTPLKHYSSGMQLRLAFAVAAFLEPEILVIDEVLAVGDAEFQKKCMGKMEDVSKSGRTILFVSHSINALRTLCTRGIYLNQGQVKLNDTLNNCIKSYLQVSMQSNAHFVKTKSQTSKEAEITEVKVLNKDGFISDHFHVGDDLLVEISWSNHKGVAANPSVELHSLAGIKIFWTSDSVDDFDGRKKNQVGQYKSYMKIPGNLLNAGDYVMHIGLDLAIPLKNYDCVLRQIYLTLSENINTPSLAKGQFNLDISEYALLPVFEWRSERL